MARRHDILQQDATLFHLSHSMAPGEAASPITRITPIIRSGASSMPFLTSPDHRVQEAAAEALTILAGVGEDRQVVFDAEKRHGFDNLTTAQQHSLSVLMYDAEVNNGGHSQYCVNPSGNDWKIALAGLRAIGAPSRAAILQDAAALFGTDGPAVDTETRRKQLIALTKQQQEAMSALDDRYYRNTENLEALLAQFAINNREHFGGKQ